MIDANTKNLIASMFGKCELALRCKDCKEVITTLSVSEILELDAAKAQARGMAVMPTVTAHKCKKTGALPWA